MKHDYESYRAEYCESCGSLVDASEKIVEEASEPVHRIDILEALGGVSEVHETTATEEGDCERCGGQLVKRWYAVGDVPEYDGEVPEDAVVGRDPDEDALIDFGPVGGDWQEVREVSWIEEGDDA